MAKNTSSSAFRKIDIDQYNEDNFREEEAEQSIPTGPDEVEVCTLLNQGRYIDALKVVLNNAPVGSANQQIKKLIILLSCSYYGFASQHSHHVHTIPVENYETELQVLGEHVEIPETPVRVIKITKTVAVKVPVPYPVKVIEKVPYPVHINKPYPVPVPQIVKVPHVQSPPQVHAHEPLGSQGSQSYFPGNSYQVQEAHSRDGHSNEDSYGPETQSYNGGNSGHSQSFAPHSDEYSSEESSGNSYGAPSSSYYGNAGGNDAESFESKNYGQAIKDYLHKLSPSGDSAGLNTFNYN